MDWLLNLFRNKTEVETVLPENAELNLPHVVWIHGANASSLSFNFVRSKLPNLKSTLIDYSSSNGFYNNLNDIVEKVKPLGPVFVVGHSLGGLYALHLTRYVDVIGGVSISTPFRGSSTADWARFIVPKHQLFRDIGRKSKPIVEARGIYPTVPWLQIVSTAGNVPWHNGPNDGVVTIASMEHFSDRMDLTHIPVNHYEIMCSDLTVNAISSRIVL